MGWWDWIVGAVAGNSDTAPSPRSASNSTPASQPTGSVATLEPPDTSASEAEDDCEEAWWTPSGVVKDEPTPISTPDLSHEDRAFENLLVSNFDGHNLSMPHIPHVLETVLRFLRDPKCNFTKLATLIGDDQVTAAAVLRLANSPMYRGVAEITTIKPAITRLGAKAIHTLMMHQALRSTTFSHKGGYRAFAERIWRSSLACSCIMRGLSKFTSLDCEDAALIGLLHNIGQVIVLRLADDEATANRYETDYERFEYFCQECHQEFGELVAEEWKLQGALKALISDHHTYPTGDDSLRIARIQLFLSDMINSMIGYGPTARYNLLQTRAVIDLGLADRQDFLTYLAALPQEIDDFVLSV